MEHLHFKEGAGDTFWDKGTCIWAWQEGKDLLYLAHSLDGSMASTALDDDSRTQPTLKLERRRNMEKHNSDLPKTSIADVAGGQRSASVQAMLNKISATAKKKEKKAKKKNKKQKAGDASGNNKRKSNKRKLKKQIKHTVDSILSRKSFVPSGEGPNGDENASDKPSSELVCRRSRRTKFSDDCEEFLLHNAISTACRRTLCDPRYWNFWIFSFTVSGKKCGRRMTFV